jgi:indolepyruvate ferredoxin oxidoreductase beta subunit
VSSVSTRPITILLCALGGEGGGVLSEWLFDTAVHAGHAAQSTSIPGVAQRTGATTYYVEIHPQPESELGGRRPVFSLNAVPGAIDLLVSSELLETLRQVAAGMVSPERTLVVSATSRALTVAEKQQPTDGRANSAALMATLQRHARAAELLDLADMARRADTVISAVMFGAIAASGVLPFSRRAFEDTIRASGKGDNAIRASLKGFALAFDTVARRREQRALLDSALESVPPETAPVAPAKAPVDLRALARTRLTDYQDSAYARLYEERLSRVSAAETAADPDGLERGAITEETTRWLALWMAFDDIVRVAALKLRASRQRRVRREVAAREGEILKVYDHFKPGVPEIAALLPTGLAQRLLAWDRRRIAQGREPWALPLQLGTHTVLGVVALRVVASLKGARRRGSRFVLEQRLIVHWLQAIERGAREHWSLGHELALCGRMIKGYGSTNERGKENLLHIINHLAFDDLAEPGSQRSAEDRAAAVRAARVAALADGNGSAFDLALQAQGAAPRAPREQTVRWFKRRPDGSAPVRVKSPA